MIDTGRRHFPLPLLKVILDGMAASKLNVLHLHLSDFGGYRVHSPAYPALTSNLLDDHGGRLFFYPAEVTELVLHASDRGIRIIPEVDLPGHAAGLVPLAGPQGIQFCTALNVSSGLLPSQVYDDPEGRSYAVLQTLLRELFPLFPDRVFHLGADETGRDVNGDLCSKQGQQKHSNAAQIERKLLKLVEDNGKQPAGWEEMLTETEAAVNTSAIISAWSQISAAQATFAGLDAVECDAKRFYLDHPKGPSRDTMSWANLTTYWTDIAPACQHGSKPQTNETRCFPKKGDVHDPQWQRMLGGEVSLWSDHYCHWSECHAVTGGEEYPRGCAWFLSGLEGSDERQAQFATSATAMLFPRVSVAAGSFWNYQKQLKMGDSRTRGELWERLALHAALLKRRGVVGCPMFGNICSDGCSEAAICGKGFHDAPVSRYPLEGNCPYHL